MNHAQNCKVFQALAPISLNGAGTTLVIDTAGFDYLEIYVCFGLVGAADCTVLKVSEADAKTDSSTLTSGTDITGLIVGTSTPVFGDATQPGDADDGLIWGFHCDLRARKRYIDLSLTTGAASLVSVLARLSRAEQGLDTAAATGLASLYRA